MPPEGDSPSEKKEIGPKEFLVYYTLSSLMNVQAESEYGARDEAVAKLHTLIYEISLEEIASDETSQARLGDAEVSIDLVEEIPIERTGTSPTERPIFRKGSFEITRLSRADLEELGFDISQVDDETMERLARKMDDDYVENHFWLALEILAEMIGIPKHPEDEASLYEK